MHTLLGAVGVSGDEVDVNSVSYKRNLWLDIEVALHTSSPLAVIPFAVSEVLAKPLPAQRRRSMRTMVERVRNAVAQGMRWRAYPNARRKRPDDCNLNLKEKPRAEGGSVFRPYTASRSERCKHDRLELNFCPLLSGAFHSNRLRAIAGVRIDRDRGADRSRDCWSKTDPD